MSDIRAFYAELRSKLPQRVNKAEIDTEFNGTKVNKQRKKHPNKTKTTDKRHYLNAYYTTSDLIMLFRSVISFANI